MKMSLAFASFTIFLQRMCGSGNRAFGVNGVETVFRSFVGGILSRFHNSMSEKKSYNWA